VACVGWSGDISQLALDNPDLRFVIPEAGGMRWSDIMIIPTGASNLDNVARWMDYVYDPVNAARIAAFVGYNSPVEGVRDELRKDPETAPLADSPLMFPDEATLERTYVFASLDEDQEAQFEERFSAITGA
jgi:spermidine/putrescine transport system substrate-binding protein